MFLKHRAADNDSTPAVSETSRGLKKEKYWKKGHKFPSNSSLWRKLQLIWKEYFEFISAHICIKG